MKPTTSPALDADALYSKSQVYIRRGLRAQVANDREEYQLWASLALELLGKAALAKVHPALIADPNHPQSTFAACGRQLSADVKTITAKTLFERLSHIEKGFDTRHKTFCEQMALRRNSELHSGESPLSGMAPSAWEREFWGAMEMILTMQGSTLESWLGADEAAAPLKIIEQAEEAAQWAVSNRISRHRADFEAKYSAAKARKKVLEESKTLSWRLLTWDGSARIACPSCSGSAFLGGSLWSEDVIETLIGSQRPDGEGHWYEDQPSETVEKTFTSEAFECPVCGLTLYGTNEIAAAELAPEFTGIETREMEFEPEGDNE